jgi:hypothetical protein
MDPIYGQWPRTPYGCGPTGEGKHHNRGNYPYQELVFGCAADPPIVDNAPLWQPLPLSLPDLTKAEFKNPLSLANFVFPYAKMDMPTPQPFHQDQTPAPASSKREAVLGSPKLKVSDADVKVGLSADGGGATSQSVGIENTGSGVLAWYAIPSDPWVSVAPYAGGTPGAALPCDQGAPCDRQGRLEISIDTTRAPPTARSATVKVQALGTNQTFTINVEVSRVIRLGVPGVTKQ